MDKDAMANHTTEYRELANRHDSNKNEKLNEIQEFYEKVTQAGVRQYCEAPNKG